MSAPFRVARATNSSLSSAAGKLGQLVMNTTEKRVVLMDGATTGGIPMARKDEILSPNNDIPDMALVPTYQNGLDDGTSQYTGDFPDMQLVSIYNDGLA